MKYWVNILKREAFYTSPLLFRHLSGSSNPFFFHSSGPTVTKGVRQIFVGYAVLIFLTLNFSHLSLNRWEKWWQMSKKKYLLGFPFPEFIVFIMLFFHLWIFFRWKFLMTFLRIFMDILCGYLSWFFFQFLKIFEHFFWFSFEFLKYLIYYEENKAKR